MDVTLNALHATLITLLSYTTSFIVISTRLLGSIVFYTNIW